MTNSTAITKVMYGYTVNRGNYESERIDMEATVALDDDPVEAMLRLRSLVLSFAGKEKEAELMDKAAEERAGSWKAREGE